MSYRQFREIRLRDFRCFHERQTVPLAPLTLLVGENSTGKTSFLAAVRAVWDAAHGSGDPDFRKPPFDLGSFPEIVYRRGGRGNGANCFDDWFPRNWSPANRLLDSRCRRSNLATLCRRQSTSTWREGSGVGAALPVGWEGRSYRLRVARVENGTAPLAADIDHPQHPGRVFFPPAFGLPSPSRNLRGTPATSRRCRKVRHASRTRTTWPRSRSCPASSRGLRAEEAPFASAPNHPSPQRTYDPIKLSSDPWGTDVPSRFANLHLRDRDRVDGAQGKARCVRS